MIVPAALAVASPFLAFQSGAPESVETLPLPWWITTFLAWSLAEVLAVGVVTGVAAWCARRQQLVGPAWAMAAAVVAVPCVTLYGLWASVRLSEFVLGYDVSNLYTAAYRLHAFAAMLALAGPWLLSGARQDAWRAMPYLVGLAGVGIVGTYVVSYLDLLAHALVTMSQAALIVGAWFVRGSAGATFDGPRDARHPSRAGASTQAHTRSAPRASSRVTDRRIFLSYRRDDSADVTGRIYDRLIATFGPEHVLKDVDSIPLGVDFRTHLNDMVAGCDLLVAVVGDRWLTSEGADGRRRLDDPKDFVRIEIESALARDVPVIPVLVRGAAVPRESDLPAPLVPFAYRNGLSVRADPDFHRDMDRLIEGVGRHLGRGQT